MTTAQRRVMWTGIGFALVMLLFPPWRVGFYSYGRSSTGPYAPIFLPPSQAAGIDTLRLGLQIVALGLVSGGLFVTLGRGGLPSNTEGSESADGSSQTRRGTRGTMLLWVVILGAVTVIGFAIQNASHSAEYTASRGYSYSAAINPLKAFEREQAREFRSIRGY